MLSVSRFVDAARVEELHDLVVAAFRDLPIAPPSSVLQESQADFLLRLQTETALVVEADGALVGSLFCATKENSLFIGRLAVRSDFRRRRVAGALLDAAKAEARQRGIGRLTLATRIALAGNLALFRKHGFAVFAEQTHAGFSRPTSYDMELMLG